MASGRDRTWAFVHAERRALADDLDRLSPEQWGTPSLCPGWTVHDVVAHMVDSAKTTRLGFLSRMVVARGDFDRDNETGIARERFADPKRTLDAFRGVIDRTSTPPAPLVTRVVEQILHGEDIRRPLGIEHEYPSDQLVSALQYLLRTSVQVGGARERADGLRLAATDADVLSGDGDEVRGTVSTLLVAISGRPVAPGELHGPAADRLVSN